MTTEVLSREVSGLFVPSAPDGPRRFGLELEVLPLDASGRRVAVDGESVSTLGVLRPLARREGWRERRSPKGTPIFDLPEGSHVTFEPGGQLEVSVPPLTSASNALRRLEAVVRTIEDASASHGIAWMALGIDPQHGREDVPRQFDCDRYRRMQAYFDAIGPAGVRMMRQTATLHVNLDFGRDPARTWRLTNALAPALVAMFANSARYRGEDSGYLSYRAETWRTLDWSRTGLVDRGGDPVAEYLDFALSAGALLVDPEDGDYPRFDALWREGRADLDDWRDHLGTLFPEVRPRGYLEVRSIDALPLRWVAAPVVFLAGLVYDDRASRLAGEILGQGRTALLHLAGAHGLGDSRLASQAADLMDVALEGCRRLGPDVVSPDDLDTAEAFFDRYTRRRRSPAHDDITSVPSFRLAGASR